MAGASHGCGVGVAGTGPAHAAVAANMAAMARQQITHALGRPGLFCVEMTALDEGAVRAAAQVLADIRQSLGVGHLWRIPGHDGVRARVPADLVPEADGWDGSQLTVFDQPQ
ncbi:DUF6207 family protein [Streptomyces beijiangensis]|uniref:Uncharacterized protein n=1 Tax=Streptomyces beijiangensis TaxID=163361 RepID=A0A939F8U4_9ACTN|nr:DUF6207 family protein [Streptomyces beijiangensis]MBO0514177.1 hypothetical protein [Streptomyces beijiangensis]